MRLHTSLQQIANAENVLGSLTWDIPVVWQYVLETSELAVHHGVDPQRDYSGGFDMQPGSIPVPSGFQGSACY